MWLLSMEDFTSGPCRGPSFLVSTRKEAKKRPGGGADREVSPAKEVDWHVTPPSSRPPPGPPPGPQPTWSVVWLSLNAQIVGYGSVSWSFLYYCQKDIVKILHDPSSNTNLFPRSTDLPSGRLPPRVRRGPGGGTWGESGLKSGFRSSVPSAPRKTSRSTPSPQAASLPTFLSAQESRAPGRDRH